MRAVIVFVLSALAAAPIGCRSEKKEPTPAAAAKTAPSQIIGVWEKTEAPGKGLRVEFSTQSNGLIAGLIVAPAALDDEIRAIFTKRSGGDASVGALKANCFVQARPAGMTKFRALKPIGPSKWKGTEIDPVIIDQLCTVGRKTYLPVEIEINGAGEMRTKVTKPADNVGRVWKRVAKAKS